MEQVSRRSFFKQAGAAAAFAGAATVAPISVANALAGTTPIGEPELTPQEDLRADEALIAHVQNARTGEISLFIGQREITIHDRKVAAPLVRATR